MRLEVISIGSEILKGSTINSNAAFISSELRKKGYMVDQHIVLPDSPSIVKEELKKALDRSDVVITTGGLGPTLDDLTKKIMTDLFQSKMRLDEAVQKDLTKRFPGGSSIQEQATVPENAEIMLNTVGTAPGFIFTENSSSMIVLPGVPKEMKEMFLKDALPFIEKHFILDTKLYMETVHICLLPEVQIDAFLRKLNEEDSSVEIGIYPSLGLLRITFTVKDTEEKAKKRIAPLREKLIKAFSSYVFDAPNGNIEEAVHQIFIENGLMLGAAESCTGGALAAALTAIPDSSKYFLGSIVSYSNLLKEKALEVTSETLETYGAVSDETVQEMIKGVFRICSSDYAVAISGIAGPSGGTEEKPVGTVYIAIGSKGNAIFSGKIMAQGDRASIIEYTIHFALSSLWRYVVFKEPPTFQ